MRTVQTPEQPETVFIGRGWRRRNTHCRHGHEYTEENSCITSQGWRVCRQCRRDRWNAGHWNRGRSSKNYVAPQKTPKQQAAVPVNSLYLEELGKAMWKAEARRRLTRMKMRKVKQRWPTITVRELVSVMPAKGGIWDR